LATLSARASQRMARSKTALLFSGGKDSVVCLHLLRDSLDDVEVLWARPGTVTPAQDDFMAEVRGRVAHFTEVRGDSDNWIERNGWPVKVVPVLHTNVGAAITDVGTRYSPFTSCCHANKFEQIERHVVRNGIERVITGQKRCDTIRNKAQESLPGFIHPLADWTDEDVMSYIGTHGLEYSDAHDCSHCTAFGQTKDPAALAALAELKSILSAEVEQLGA